MGRSKTIMAEVQRVEDILKSSLQRVDVIEKNLSTKLLTLERREKLESELEEMKQVLRLNEKKLQGLRKDNTESFMIAACLVFITFLFFGIYCMFFRDR